MIEIIEVDGHPPSCGFCADQDAAPAELFDQVGSYVTREYPGHGAVRVAGDFFADEIPCCEGCRLTMLEHVEEEPT